MTANRKANVALAASLIFLLLSSCAAYLAFSRLSTSEHWLHHTHDVQNSMAQFAMTVARASRLRAEFADTGDLTLLPRFSEEVSQIRNVMGTIERLTADNQRQQGNLDELRKLSEQRITLMQESVDLKRSGKSTLETQFAITRQIVATAEDTDILLQQMYNNEENLMTDRQNRVRTSSWAATAVLVVSLFLTLILFLVHHRLVTDQVAARGRAEAAQRALSVRLLALQDQERRRFARELHDSVGQHLAALKMALSLLQGKLPGDTTLRDCMSMVDASIAETRTISHLLHPPLLDEAGLISAAQWFVDGFGKRSSIETTLKVSNGGARLPEATELVLFRVLQESLTNVHRHSGATRADVSLNVQSDCVTLWVRDNGHGMPPALLLSLRESGSGGGVGLAGMTERLREIGGRLEVESGSTGTEIRARVPFRKLKQPDVAVSTAQEVRG
ncbi:MAG TPA: ATP-binding protein [Candidatus Solibacter sp.]|nr:ATP-binding protein [Candidatus Solibacter sp.]